MAGKPVEFSASVRAEVAQPALTGDLELAAAVSVDAQAGRVSAQGVKMTTNLQGAMLRGGLTKTCSGTIFASNGPLKTPCSQLNASSGRCANLAL